MSQGNPPYAVVLTRAAARGLSKLPKKDLERILAKAQGLEDNPRPRGVEKLTDRGERYRIRSGDYRIVYLIDDEERLVEIETIGNRRDVYRE
ncbi:cytotoxic translational repressor of toxin-antitoxin stability system [Singulisphaera acidiphila DSM 18658]|uniref:Cytotoxic translational repressor of toxin-antitoxin stability system n=2 Tax=Singulisphaera acidiphila TaxID=466153 RepID=L0DE25_SINAD|nr:cytotoxic translational repressor of toxin-antitoxin stability system [Singulisphaera acidiphila DSM 18658]